MTWLDRTYYPRFDGAEFDHAAFAAKLALAGQARRLPKV